MLQPDSQDIFTRGLISGHGRGRQPPNDHVTAWAKHVHGRQSQALKTSFSIARGHHPQCSVNDILGDHGVRFLSFHSYL